MASIVLDASAVLAVLLSEPGAERVESVMGEAMISAVNFAEVVSRLVDKGAPLHEIRENIGTFGVPIAGFEADLAEATGLLRGRTRNKGLSLADCACLALAEREGLTVLTADKRWAQLDLEIDIRLVR